MVIECLQCWWNGQSPVPVFFDVAELHRHNRIIHQPNVYHGQELIAAPWVAVGFTYQAAFTETGELVLAHPWPPEEREAPTTSAPVLPAVSAASAVPSIMLWEEQEAYGLSFEEPKWPLEGITHTLAISGSEAAP